MRVVGLFGSSVPVFWLGLVGLFVFYGKLDWVSGTGRLDVFYEDIVTARPGVTGLAQVNGCRGPTETEEKIKARTRYDVEYVRNWTWWREVEIVAATVAVLFWKKDPGAL